MADSLNLRWYITWKAAVKRLVLDTNVVLDWLVFADPAMAALAQSIQAGRVTLFSHPDTIAELAHVLRRDALERFTKQAPDALERFGRYASPVPAELERLIAERSLPSGFPRCRDPDDDLFLALAYHAKADALITKDKALLALAARARRHGVPVLTIEGWRAGP